MVTTPYPEYESLGILDGYKTLTELQDELAQIELDLKNGYTRNLKSEDVNARGKKQDLAQFSDLRNSFIEKQKTIIARKSALSTVLQKKAKAYVPLTGPELDITKEEKRIVGIILKSPTEIPTEPAAPAPQVTATPGRVLTEAESRALATDKKLPDSNEAPKGGGGGGGGVTVKAKRADVIAGLAALKLPDTAANRQTVRDQIKAGKLPGGAGATTGLDAGWQDRFKKEYPAYAWMLTELDQTKYADLFQLMNDAVKPGSEYTDELFQRKFVGTSWYTELAAGETGRALTTAVGSYSWGEGQLAKFLTTATRYGYKDATLKSKAYEALFAKDPVTGKYINPSAIGEVKASNQFLSIKKIGTSFLTPVSDESVIDTLVGGRSSDDVMRVARESAKVKFPHLSNAIDAGVTLEELGYQYQQNAAKLLEVDPNTIDMASTMYAKAFGSTKDPMMSTSEWETYVKGNSDLGWQFTKQANQQATDIGLTLARAFGKVR